MQRELRLIPIFLAVAAFLSLVWAGLTFAQPSDTPPASPPTAADSYANGRVMFGHTPHRLILFTFDDGPDTNTTPVILDKLDQRGIHAVFFLEGGHLLDDARAAVGREIVRRGHTIGSHSFRHLRMDRMSEAQVKEQLDRSDAAFMRVFGSVPNLFRPPYGMRSAMVDRLLAERGRTAVIWNLNPRDYSERTADAVFKNFRTHLRYRTTHDGDKGGIILMHDTHTWSLEAFDLIYDYLMAENCRLLDTPGEELFDVVSDPAFFFELRGSAGPSAEAREAQPAAALLAERQNLIKQATRARCSNPASR